MNRHLTALMFATAFAWSCNPGDAEQTRLSAADVEAIAALRTALVDAIEAGDAAQYASLCTEDVQLLHPNAPLVTGRADLQSHNAAIFEVVRVVNLQLTPREVYGSGDLAYEVGTQELAIEPALSGFQSKRKYVHVFKRGADGAWRFAVLISNDSE